MHGDHIMVKHTLKILQQMLQDFQIFSVCLNISRTSEILKFSDH